MNCTGCHAEVQPTLVFSYYEQRRWQISLQSVATPVQISDTTRGLSRRLCAAQKEHRYVENQLFGGCLNWNKSHHCSVLRGSSTSSYEMVNRAGLARTDR